MKLDELKKLHPEERIRKLKQLEEERKNEIKEAEDMLKFSKAELEDEIARKMRLPEHEAVEIERLFRPRKAPSEKEEKPKAEAEQPLEETVAETKPPELAIAEQQQYQIAKLEDTFRRKSTYDISKALNPLADKSREDLNAYQQNQIEAAYHVIKEREQIYGRAEGQRLGTEIHKVMSLHSRIMEEYRGG